jgi:anthranilate synthase component 2
VRKDSLTEGPLKVLASDEFGEIMAISHQDFDVVGLQFHPESIINEHGLKMIRNWADH